MIFFGENCKKITVLVKKNLFGLIFENIDQKVPKKSIFAKKVIFGQKFQK